VIRGIVFKCLDYGVLEENVLGIRFGLKGFQDPSHKPMKLTRKVVETIHMEGGTILGTSNAPVNTREIVKVGLSLMHERGLDNMQCICMRAICQGCCSHRLCQFITLCLTGPYCCSAWISGKLMHCSSLGGLVRTGLRWISRGSVR
jgi:hypothetical protein